MNRLKILLFVFSELSAAYMQLRICYFFTTAAFKNVMGLLIWRLLFNKELWTTWLSHAMNYMHIYKHCLEDIWRYKSPKQHWRVCGERKNFSPRVQSTFHLSEWKSSLHFDLTRSCTLSKISYRSQLSSTTFGNLLSKVYHTHYNWPLLSSSCIARLVTAACVH